jgi:2-iminobutanoate/2-iminopropanoate deaminase
MANVTYGPYSPLRRVGDLVFISGQVGIHPETKIAAKDVAQQTERAILNMEAILRDEKMTLDNVFKTTVFLTNMDSFDAMNEVYERRFNTPRPARSCVGVQELPRVGGNVEILVEIEAMAQVSRK